MTHSHFQGRRLLLAFSLTAALFFSTLVSPPVHAQSRLPVPSTHVSDTAGAVPEAAKQQLENILANLQQRSEVNFVVLTVPTTGGMDRYAYAADVARDWDIASRSTTG